MGLVARQLTGMGLRRMERSSSGMVGSMVVRMERGMVVHMGRIVGRMERGMARMALEQQLGRMEQLRRPLLGR